MPFKQKISPGNVQEWIKRHAAGDTMSKIAADDNVHVSTVSRRLRAAARTQRATPAEPPPRRPVDGPPAAAAGPGAANVARITSASDSSSSDVRDQPNAAAPISIPAGARVLYAPDSPQATATTRVDQKAFDQVTSVAITLAE